VSRELVRRAFDAVERLLTQIASRFPQFAFAAARLAGTSRQRLSRRWPAADEIAQLLPQLMPREAEALARRIAAEEAMQRVLTRAVRRHGVDYLRPIVSFDASLAALRAPAILTTLHVGAIHALSSALEHMPAPVLAFRDGFLFESKGTLTQQSTRGGELRRAGAFHRALSHLRSGGFVVIGADVVPGASIGVPFLGETIRLARGPFALSRMTNAPIVPIVARREGRAIVVTAGAPIAADPADETALAIALARWFEEWLRARPEDLSVALVNSVLRD